MSVETCSPSMACDREEVCSDSARKMQDEEETTSEASRAAATKEKEKEMWRVEPEDEAERPEATEGEGRYEPVRANIIGERENQKAPSEEGVETQSPKRKVIQVESEETQDYVRETLNLSRDEAEETSFVPRAIGISQRPMFWCDKRCSDKALRFWQCASVVVEVSSVTTKA